MHENVFNNVKRWGTLELLLRMFLFIHEVPRRNHDERCRISRVTTRNQN